MARPHVPQFGNWEGQQNVPYTVVFDKARQGRGGKMVNPNDPQQIPELYNNPNPTTRPRTTEQNKPVQRPVHERKPSREGNAGRRADGIIGEGNRRTPSRTSIGSDHSIDRSPLHAQSQPKKTGRGTTPGRSGPKPRDDDFNRGTAIPAFGNWDPSNPESGDGFTKIFKNASEEKHTGTPNIITETHDYSHSTPNNKNRRNKSKSSLCTIL
ncbi:unnamed protein product [Rhodiola kirilowii]